MLKDSNAFSSYAVDHLDQARTFYKEILELLMKENPMGLIESHTHSRVRLLIYAKSNHKPATFTILNFRVENIDVAVDDLASRGVKMDQCEDKTDEKDIQRGEAHPPSPGLMTRLGISYLS